jgi:hypothetical protein
MVIHTHNLSVPINPPMQSNYPMNPTNPVMHPQTYQPQMMNQMPMTPFFQMPTMPPFILPPHPSAYQPLRMEQMPSAPNPAEQLYNYPPINMNLPFPPGFLPYGYYPQYYRPATSPGNHINAMDASDCYWN